MSQASTELLSALQILCNTSRESLRAFRGLDTWERVKVVINSIDDDSDTSSENEDLLQSSLSCLSSSTPSIISSQSHRSSSAILPAPTCITPSVENISTSGAGISQRKRKDICVEFLNEVKNVLPNLIEFSTKYQTLEAIPLEKEFSLDKRILFLKVVYGSKVLSQHAEEHAGAAIGMLPILSFAYLKFRLLKYDQYPRAIDALLLEDRMVNAIKGLSKWTQELITTFQSPYQRDTGILQNLFQTQSGTILDSLSTRASLSEESVNEEVRQPERGGSSPTGRMDAGGLTATFGINAYLRADHAAATQTSSRAELLTEQEVRYQGPHTMGIVTATAKRRRLNVALSGQKSSLSSHGSIQRSADNCQAIALALPASGSFEGRHHQGVQRRMLTDAADTPTVAESGSLGTQASLPEEFVNEEVSRSRPNEFLPVGRTGPKRRRPDIAPSDLTGTVFGQRGPAHHFRNSQGQADGDVPGHGPMVTNRVNNNHLRVQHLDSFTQASSQQANIINQLPAQSTAHLNLDNPANTSSANHPNLIQYHTLCPTAHNIDQVRQNMPQPGPPNAAAQTPLNPNTDQGHTTPGMDACLQPRANHAATAQSSPTSDFLWLASYANFDSGNIGLDTHFPPASDVDLLQLGLHTDFTLMDTSLAQLPARSASDQPLHHPGLVPANTMTPIQFPQSQVQEPRSSLQLGIYADVLNTNHAE
ncbi:uncharacterized protein GIQ15_03623 [Arthroderma uncinatum]|uniref:uncharacterized protein n=1 Tax=Arthroderma uncinatum TaxID=74035 RepID=UPI00144AF4B4|nr:uncharacterized protein GIQ15_03623 [Arthroderma uncinatum]KAF3484299.1 hypothetical protein GIQ15_03623 [Arthroderma uncinatum]